MCLRFGDGYLMIEIGGVSRNRRKSNSENPTILSFNVDDVSAAAEWLAKRGVTVRLARGEVGRFWIQTAMSVN